MSNPSPKPLKILVAEDSAADRMILQSMLMSSGHEVLLAEDGQQAIDAFSEYRPDLVFLDVIMPNVDGIMAARAIKERAGDELTPVIFLTSLADAESLATCLDAGGDDFLSKPYNQIILDSKIRAFARMREMHQTLVQNHKHLIQEQNIAKQVFDKIAHAGTLNLEYIRYYMSALAVFNGDVLLADLSPRGSLFLLLGDFTGHGLPAAIGSMPLASTFYGMVRKGFTMSDILREINQKLYQTLPVGLFCCAAFVDIDIKRMRLRVWNGGMPDNILFRQQTLSYDRIRSRNLPLGVLSNREFKSEPEAFPLTPGDHLLMWSDGIQEARNRAGDMFGEARLNLVLDQCPDPAKVFLEILRQVQAHIGSSEKDDDISLVDITIPDAKAMESMLAQTNKNHEFLENWSLSFRMDASSLRGFNPLSLLIHVLSEVPGLRQSGSALYTLLSELFNNAVEHGVLQLSSKIKDSRAGFADYYRLRREGLARLENAFVEFDFQHEVLNTGGLLTITVTDSGPGFDHSIRESQSENPSITNYYGRGLNLIASIAESLEIIPPGNKIRACYRWTFED